MAEANSRSRHVISASLLGVTGMTLAVGGLQLLLLGGSSYYLIAGATLVAITVLLLRRHRFAPLLYALFVFGTLCWSLYEVGLEPWGLLARLGMPLLLGLGLLRACILRHTAHPSHRRWPFIFAAAAILGGLTAILFVASHPLSGGLRAGSPLKLAPGSTSDWSAFGATEHGTRYSKLDQITPDNIHRLTLAWTYRTGDLPHPADAQTAWSFEATPLKIADTVFLCTAHSIVHAIDAETGQRRWLYDPKVPAVWVPLRACRGVAFYRSPHPLSECPERIIAPIGDGRLIALDSHTGRPCPGFGHTGQINLLEHLGSYPPGYALPTSPPAIVNDHIIVGGYVMDGTMVGAPSGVIRAFDAVTGELSWAWDMGQPDRTGAPAEGERYTPGTPNAWPPLSADERLGLVYVPLGNATPDFFGRHRSAAAETYGSSIVALDVQTGRPRWHFQVDHHDLWDHDLPAQPSLIELPTPNGLTPALVLPTKRGELFVLDRRTGQPLTQVDEKPVPQGAAAGDYTSATQPFSTGMPSFAGADLNEARMWGMTPLDQLWCRLRFRELRYEGQFTPPSVRGSLVYPGSAGIFSWGGVAIDEARGILIANTVHSPFVVTLIPRKTADAEGLSTAPNTDSAADNTRGTAERNVGARAGMPQVGTPYAARALPFLSPAGIPCLNPPWGQLSAIDLSSRKLLWKQPFGTSIDNGPFGWETGLPLPVGVASAGGALSLGTGVFLIAASQDRYLRAFATRTGRELWRVRLPAGGQATPITYLSAPSGRQFVVIAAGGHGGLNTRVGDYVLAYTLQ